MLDISVIIVNYNVRYFIEQCLTSVIKAKQDLNIEIIVVDNNSVDNSVAAIRNKFPSVHLIANKENVGFAKANNQAIKISKGKYFLLLNPDTLIEEDTLVKIFNFMEKNPDAGALGVKLIDGEGKFLPESKRSLPTLLTSLYRFVGLSKLFPKSKVFNKYNLGHFDEDKTYEVDVLCGAFMFIRSDILPKVGYLDEDFFMYGEDIDYSYRIKSAGYKVYYYPETTIIHFKGESTKKSSLKYHNIFYKAMAIFAKKHYGGKSINPLLWLINIAVFGLAFINYFKSVLKRFLLPFIDSAIFFIVLLTVQKFWASFHFHNPEYYDTKRTSIIYLGFTVIWLISIFLSDGYKKNRVSNSIKGLTIGSIIILVIYSLLPESYRFSRAIVLISSMINIIALLVSRFALSALLPSLFNKSNLKKKTIIIGNPNDIDRVKRIMNINGVNYEFSGALSPRATDKDFSNDFVGNISNLEEVIDTFGIDEVIFCLGTLEMSDVMDRMKKIGNRVSIKIIPAEDYSIIGSSGRNSRGEFYNLEMSYNLDNKKNLFAKYSLDIFAALLLLLFSPVIKLFNRRFKLSNIFKVLFGSKTWISYIPNDKDIDELPKIKEGIYTPIFSDKISGISNKDLHNMNVIYARNYNITMDIEYLFKHIFDNKSK